LDDIKYLVYGPENYTTSINARWITDHEGSSMELSARDR
jgi:hypothetical protein